MSGSSWLGPVYELDRKLVARALWLYLARVGFLLVLLGGLTLAEIESSQYRRLDLIQQQAQTGAAFFNYIVGISMAMAFLIGPTAIVGSICQERARGTFDLFLASDLTSAEIVCGKLCARLWPALGTMAVAVPVVALATLMGGVDPEMIIGSFLVCCALAVFTSSLAMTFAIRTTRAHEALLATYAMIFFLVLFLPFACIFGPMVIPIDFDVSVDWILWLNPIHAAFASGEGDEFLQMTTKSPWIDQILVSGLMLGVSLLLTAWSTIRLRRIVTTTKVRKVARIRKISQRRLNRDERFLDRDPMYFRECRRRRTSGAMRWIWGGLIGISIVSGGLAIASCSTESEIFVLERFTFVWHTIWIRYQARR